MRLADPAEACLAYVWAHMERLGFIDAYDSASVKWKMAEVVAGKPLNALTPIELSTLASELSAM